MEFLFLLSDIQDGYNLVCSLVFQIVIFQQLIKTEEKSKLQKQISKLLILTAMAP